MTYTDPFGLEKWIWVSPIWDSTIYRGAKADIDVPGVLTIYAHGAPNAINGDTLFRTYGPALNASDIASLIRESGWQGDLVWLESCRTGQEPFGLAQQLANLLGKPVVAPTTQSWFSPNGPTGLWGKTPQGQKDLNNPGSYKVFTPNQGVLKWVLQ